jgi:conjugal transfer pilus assembly protein TraW
MEGMEKRVIALGIVLLGTFLIVPPCTLQAKPKDLGVYGNLYPIEEVDLLAYIQERAKQVDQEELNKKMREDFEHSLEVSLNVPEVKEVRTRYVDPSITVASPVYDHKGHVVALSGNINPLDKIQLTNTIVALKESQIGIIPDLKKYHKNLLVLLTDGNLTKAAEKIGQMVYKGDSHILERLGVERVPSVITQEGTKLRVEEILVKSNSR